jgi:anti-sigma-K factor RskA
MTGNGHNTPEELAAFAMHSLPAEEAASMKAHLDSCPECREELSQLYGDLALLAFSVEQQPLPQGARQRFLDKIAPAPAEAVVVPIKKRRGPGFWVPWSLVAGLAVACLVLTVQNRALNDELSGESILVKNLAAQASRAQQVLEVLTAPSAQRVTLTQTPAAAQPNARATYLPERGGLVLQATNLKSLPEGKTYELWVIPTSGAPVPAGLFHPDATGSATLILPHLAPGITAKALAVTVENAEGASTPTMPIVLSGSPSGS